MWMYFILMISDVHKDLSSLRIKNINWKYKLRADFSYMSNWSVSVHFDSIFHLLINNS